MQSSKKLEIKNYFNKGTYIDAKDTTNKWCVAIIIEVCHDDSTIKISFDGWQSKWDEWLKFTSSKIAPFRKYSKGYTGAKTQAYRKWVYSSEEMSLQTNFIENLLEKDFEGFSSFVLTQNLRGEYFTFLDNILTNNLYEKKSPEFFQKILNLFKLQIRLTTLFLQKLPSLYSEFNKANSNPEAFILEDQVGLAMCVHEICESFARIFGFSDRFFKFYKEYASNLVQICQIPKDDAGDDIAVKKYLVNYFKEIGGLKILLNLLNFDEQIKNNNQILPIKCLESVYKVLLSIVDGLIENDKILGVEILKNCFYRRLELLTEKEVKDFDKEIAFSFINENSNLLNEILSEEDQAKKLEKLELELALKFLKSPFFEKKLKGLTELKEISERLEQSAREKMYFSNYYNHNRRKGLKYYTTETFLNWMIENKVMEHLLGESMHLELVKRCHDLLIFMCKNKKMPPQLVIHIWNACEAKHDSLVRGIYEMLVELTSYLPIEAINLLYDKLKEIPLESYNEMTLNLLKGFCENALKSSDNLGAISEDMDENFIDRKYYGIIILWKLILDTSCLKNELIDIALINLKGIVSLYYANHLRKFFLWKCLGEIQKGSSVVQCIDLVSLLFKMFSDNKNTLTIIEKEFKGMNLAVDSLEKYFEKTKNTKITMDSIIEGKYSHKINIEKRLFLIETLYNLYDDNESVNFNLVNFTHLDILWKLFVTESRDNSEKKLYLKWLIQNDTPLFSKENLIIYQFNEILCNHNKTDYFTISQDEFDCFAIYFKAANKQAKKLKLLKSGRFIILDQDLLGKESLWNIFYNSKVKNTVSKIVDLLTDIHLRLVENEKSKKKEIYENFIIKCLTLVKKSFENQNVELVNKSIFLITAFFEKYDGNERSERSDSVINYNQSFQATIILKPDEIKKDMRVFYYEKVNNFRRRIAEEFNIPINSFKFVLKNEVIENVDDENIMMKDFSLKNTYVIQKIKRNEDIEENGYHPKHLISESQEHLDLLFNLISDQNCESANEIWNLLMKLPINEKIQKNLIDINDEWKNLIDEKSFYKTLYCLQIIDEFTFSQKKLKTDWVNKFNSTGGTKYLLDLYLNQNFDENLTQMIKKYLLLLLKINVNYAKSYDLPNSYQTNKALLKQMFEKLLNTMNSLSNYTIIRENQNLENCVFEKQRFADEKNDSQNIDNVKSPEFFIIEKEIFYYCSWLLLKLLKTEPTLLLSIYHYKKLDTLLLNTFLKTDNFLLQKCFYDFLGNLYDIANEHKLESPQNIFLPILFNQLFHKAIHFNTRAEIFFEFLELTISGYTFPKTEIEPEQALDLNLLTINLIKFIINRSPFEKTHLDKDIILIGVLITLRGLLKKLGLQSLSQESLTELNKELIGPCLFDAPNKTLKQELLPKCKSFEARNAAFSLILVLSHDLKCLTDIIEFFKPIHKDGDWRTKNYSDWNIVPKRDEKSETGYVGLKNLGCICYMNSLLQQFYMIPSFRKSLLEVQDRNFSKVAKEDNLLYQMKCLFLSLTESEKQYHNPKHFCQAFKDWEGNPTNVYEQRDVDEFCNMLLDKIENSVKGTGQQDFIKQHFGGVLSNEFICKDCPHYSEREEQFLAVSLPVKNKKNIAESLSSFVEGEMLEGENAYLCEICNKKVATLKRVCLKKLPKHLILVLKRFEFDFDTMSKVKVNDSCEFPMNINFEKYTQQGLRKEEKNKKNNVTTKEYENETNYPPEYFEYKLKGVVIHMGIADSGHYYSLIQERESNNEQKNLRWLEFNDTQVKEFDEKDIPNEAFGGEEKWSYYGMSNMTSIKEKIKNAYLLFYERPYDEEVQSPPIKNEECKDLEISNNIDNVDYTAEFLKDLHHDNLKFHIHKNIFGPEYFKFMTNLITSHNFTENDDIIQYPYEYDQKQNLKKHFDLELIKLGLFFLLTAIIREKDRYCLTEFLPHIKLELQKNVPACMWLIHSFTNKKVLEEFLLSCFEKIMREFVIGLLSVSIQRVMFHEKQKLSKTDENGYPTTLISNFINLTIDIIPDCKTSILDYTEFFQLFLFFSKLNSETANYLLQNRLIGRLMDFCFKDNSRKEKESIQYNELLESPIGLPKEPIKKALTGIDELRRKKKEKTLMEAFGIGSNKGYLWATIAELFKYCKIEHKAISDKSKIEPINYWQNEHASYILNLDEYHYLKTEESIYKALCDSKIKIAVRSLAFILINLAFEDAKYSELLLNIVRRAIAEKTTSEYRPFFALIKKMITLQDSLQELRIEKLINVYSVLMNENKKYYCENACLQEFLIKIGERSSKFRTIISKHSESFNWILDYIKEKELNNFSSDHIRILNSKSLYLNRFSHPKNMQEFKLYCENKINKLKLILRDKMEETPLEWDSDEDLSEHEFKQNEKIDYFNQSSCKWLTAQVERIIEEAVHLKIFFKEDLNNLVCITKNSENLAPFGKMQDTPYKDESGNISSINRKKET